MTENINKISVLFVCMGNICRSPTGEGVFKHYVNQQGYSDKIHVDSAGTIAYHTGNPADARMQMAANKRGYRLDSIARQVAHNDLKNFDVVIAMDTSNLYELEAMAGGPREHITMLGTFLGDGTDNQSAMSVPDPYYGGPEGFEEVIDMIESACPGILEHCTKLLRE